MTISVLLVDDQVIFRKGVWGLLEATANLDAVLSKMKRFALLPFTAQSEHDLR